MGADNQQGRTENYRVYYSEPSINFYGQHEFYAPNDSKAKEKAKEYFREKGIRLSSLKGLEKFLKVKFRK